MALTSNFVTVCSALVIFIINNFGSAQYAGSACQLYGRNTLGVCKPSIECVWLHTELKAKRIHRAELPNFRCGFQGLNEIVCCGDEAPPTTTTEYNGLCDEVDDICFDKIFNNNKNIESVDNTNGNDGVTFNLLDGGGDGFTQPNTLPAKIVDESAPPRIIIRPSETACTTYTQSKLSSLTYHILNGVEVNLGEFPHMAALGYPSTDGDGKINFRCGGTLITDRHILTAAHCVNARAPKPVVVRLGVINISPANEIEDGIPVDVGIQTIKLHPDYVSNRNYHDLAIITLARSVPFDSNLHPACLRSELADPSPDKPLIITGWGRIDVNRDVSSSKLLKTNLTAISVQECNSSYTQTSNRKLPNGLNLGHFCAYDPAGLSDACQGDSGGPLQIILPTNEMAQIVGVTSFGYSCGSRIPAVYARVAYYLDWIEKEVWGANS